MMEVVGCNSATEDRLAHKLECKLLSVVCKKEAWELIIPEVEYRVVSVRNSENRFVGNR